MRMLKLLLRVHETNPIIRNAKFMYLKYQYRYNKAQAIQQPLISFSSLMYVEIILIYILPWVGHSADGFSPLSHISFGLPWHDHSCFLALITNCKQFLVSFSVTPEMAFLGLSSAFPSCVWIVCMPCVGIRIL